MSICKDCIHYEICDKYVAPNESFPEVDGCRCFKDKAVFVELNCKVGDTVYQTDGIRIYELEVFEVTLKNYKPYYETESIDFDDTAIGKSIFLTREEAERALERREK